MLITARQGYDKGMLQGPATIVFFILLERSREMQGILALISTNLSLKVAGELEHFSATF